MAKTTWKLVRDNIPAIMIAEGKTPETRILDAKSYKKALLAKLDEEVKELKLALQNNNSTNAIAEIGDVLEVLAAIAHDEAFPTDAIYDQAQEKRERVGAFLNRIQLKL